MIARIGFSTDVDSDWYEVASVDLEAGTWPGVLADALHQLADVVYESASFEQIAVKYR